MSSNSAHPETSVSPGGMDTARIETLADGIFAIVITLLVFELKVPVVPVGADAAVVLPALLVGLWPKLVSWVLSFVMIGVYWQAHHGQYHMIRRVDRSLIWLNILFFMTISLIPFSAGLLGTYPSAPISAVIYGINLILVNLSMALHWRHATNQCCLVDDDIGADTVEVAYRRILTPPVVYAIAIAFAFWDPRISILMYCLWPMVYVFKTPVDRFFSAPMRRASATQGAVDAGGELAGVAAAEPSNGR